MKQSVTNHDVVARHLDGGTWRFRHDAKRSVMAAGIGKRGQQEELT